MGEPYSTFSELIGKYFSKNRKSKYKIILIGSYSLIKNQLDKLGYGIKINRIENLDQAKVKVINLINIHFKFKKIFAKVTTKSNEYIAKSFKKSLELIKLKNNYKFILINGPITKKTFLQKKFLGITEYLSKKTNVNNEVMLIYNEKLSVSPVTTHIALKL